MMEMLPQAYPLRIQGGGENLAVIGWTQVSDPDAPWRPVVVGIGQPQHPFVLNEPIKNAVYVLPG
ncbi:hypothetical protein [Pseudonocardia humida]|uniref:Uncharacterized protein n=1 Tax=Pseudonocardia humida TaxID=2800819 RepID=A0ABT1A7K5_9PSEU|nr:hypothetical protein [Pseudonocardia humida]MCO1658989.1 hypothetical protein [Pseudonocardia humida]